MIWFRYIFDAPREVIVEEVIQLKGYHLMRGYISWAFVEKLTQIQEGGQVIVDPGTPWIRYTHHHHQVGTACFQPTLNMKG